MKILIPLILLLAGLGGGVGAGLILGPELHAGLQPTETDEHGGAQDGHAAATDQMVIHDANHGDGQSKTGLEYVRLNKQFVVPIITRNNVDSLVVMSIGIEIASGQSETVYRREPKLRDEFLRVLFDYANMGGFRGTFTDTGKLASLRTGLLGVARKTLGPSVTAVLITDLTRQDK